MRATLLLLLTLLSPPSWAQAPQEFGSPEIAFSGGPIRLSKPALAALRSHYQGDKVPLVPQPFRGRLDVALLGRDWAKVRAIKQDLIAKDGIIAALAWEQSRLIATGSLGVAEMHALDVAATGSTGLSETAVMLWFYAVAVTLTDGHKCVDDKARDAHLDKLRGPMFEPVLQILRTISDDRLAAMRELAIRLEAVLAPERNDDLMCRDNTAAPEIKPDSVWRPEAGLTRPMLPRHLLALSSVLRPRPIARPEIPRSDTRQVAKSKPAGPDPVPPLFFSPVLALPIPFDPVAEGLTPAQPTPTPTPAPVPPPPPAAIVSAPPPPAVATTATPVAQPTAPAETVKPPPPDAAMVNRQTGRPNPGRFETPGMDLTAPDPARH